MCIIKCNVFDHRNYHEEQLLGYEVVTLSLSSLHVVQFQLMSILVPNAPVQILEESIPIKRLEIV